MSVVKAMMGRTGAVLAVGLMSVGAGIAGISTASAATAPVATRAATSPACTGATTYAGKSMPGYRGTRTPCFITSGGRGYQVTVLQRFLNSGVADGSPLVIDGIYGPATKAKVKAYQRGWNDYPCSKSSAVSAVRLAVDGLWGPQTSKVSQNQLAYCGD